MANGSLDAEVEAFITSCINSVEQLEILLLLRGAKELGIETINRELRTSASSVVKRLDDLARKNLIGLREIDGQILYFYGPPERLKGTVDRLAILYTTHRVAIINSIFSKPSDMLKDFSEAFRLRDKDKDK